MTYPLAQHICNLTKGGDVLYVAHTGAVISDLLRSIAALGVPDGKVYRSNGAERVEFPWGATLYFTTIHTLHRARGRSFWHIVTDSHHYLDDPTFREALRPCFQSRMSAGDERYSVIG